MSAQKSVTLPRHLWSALDEMSRDGAQAAEALMEAAVEQFVALQGYEVPVVARGELGPVPEEHDADAHAPTAARPMLAGPPPARPEAPTIPQPIVPEPALTDVAAAHQPVNITGIAPTHVPVRSKAPAPAPAPAPAKSKAAPKPVPPPAWATRAALLDADEERSAARERMAAIDKDVERLTLERPTTTPLGQAANEEDE